MSQIHLISFATRRFLHRQTLLGRSALAYRVADTFTGWNPSRLADAGFHQHAPELALSERGAGFWAWKPFIICQKLDSVADGDIVFYCDVGRNYPFTLIRDPLTAYLAWMQTNNQSIMPGVEIPWLGKLGVWTKREALIALGMDQESVRRASVIQASFSVWKAGSDSRAFAHEWSDLCASRRMISDDKTLPELHEHPEFREHRHDQSVLSLLCFKRHLKALQILPDSPGCDAKNPGQVSRLLPESIPPIPSISGRCVDVCAVLVESLEKSIRPLIKSNCI